MVSKLLTDCVNTNCAFSSAEVSCIAVLYSFRTLELLWGSSFFFFICLFIYLNLRNSQGWKRKKPWGDSPGTVDQEKYRHQVNRLVSWLLGSFDPWVSSTWRSALKKKHSQITLHSIPALREARLAGLLRQETWRMIVQLRLPWEAAKTLNR